MCNRCSVSEGAGGEVDFLAVELLLIEVGLLNPDVAVALLGVTNPLLARDDEAVVSRVNPLPLLRLLVEEGLLCGVVLCTPRLPAFLSSIVFLKSLDNNGRILTHT